MAQEQMLEKKGVVAGVQPDYPYSVTRHTGHELTAYSAGKMG